jgi:class 3 adenylate cyclase
MAFLGCIGDPVGAPGAVPAVDPGLRAVMFTDIVGSTEMTARLGDTAALELVRVQYALVRRGLKTHGGREFKHTGDGIMASFGKPAAAVRAAADIQRRIAAYNADASESLSVRIGTHAGEPVAEHNDMFGATVQLAHRLCSEAEADGIAPALAISLRTSVGVAEAIGAPQRKNLLLRTRRPMRASDAQKRFERAGDPSRPDTGALFGGDKFASTGCVRGERRCAR